MRHRIALEAARIMVEEHIRSYYAAKQKAAERLGASQTRNLPRNEEIEAAVHQYQRLFRGDTHTEVLFQLRTEAVKAMRFFEQFNPRLVGPVLSGTADEHSDITIHVFADTPEEVSLHLLNHDVPFDSDTKRLPRSDGQSVEYPSFRFVAGDSTIDATVFPSVAIRQAPPSPVNGRPMQRANLQAVVALLEADRDDDVSD